jgi:hypothetical protein
MYRHETAQLHAIARLPTFRIVVTNHAAEQMRERDVALFEVDKILKAGAVTMVETDPGGRERWRVSGHDADGRRIEPVVQLIPPDMVVLITVIRVG